MRALLLDSQDSDLRLIAKWLEIIGLRVEMVRDGMVGLDTLLNDDAFDIVFTELHLEPLSGMSFLAALRADNRFDDLPVVFVTHDNDKTHIRQARLGGADGYPIKPLRRRTLLAKLRELGLIHFDIPEQGGGLGIPYDMLPAPRPWLNREGIGTSTFLSRRLEGGKEV